MLNYISQLPSDCWQGNWPRTLSVLGSTGSIGRSALEVVRLQKDKFKVVALAGANNLALLAEQAVEFRPDYLGVLHQTSIADLKERLPADYQPTVLAGQSGYEALASLREVELVLSAQVGAAGLGATLAAIGAGKVVALANKESLVLAGDMIRKLCQETGACILPVDSEHNAIFQALAGNEGESVSHLILTASGGPFREHTEAELAKVTVEEALNHPNWNMGAKITIDSATMMNKGLEIIEAHYLFGLALENIDVVVHKESIVHSLVEYIDGSQIAQLGQPDMRVPIAHCLGWPKRLQTGVKKLNLAECASLSFKKPDEAMFPSLALAKKALQAGKGAPVVLNAANEVAVAAFLEQELSYLGIAKLVELAINAHLKENFHTGSLLTAQKILALDKQTRVWCAQYLEHTPRF